MAGAGKNGQAIPRRACLFRWGRACVLCARLARSIVHDDLAEEVGQGFHIGIFAVCCVQHGLVYRLVAALLRIGTMRCVYHARDVLFLDLISGLGISLFLLTTVQGCMEREVYHLHPFASIWGPLAYTSQRCWYPGTRVDISPQAPRCGVSERLVAYVYKYNKLQTS